MADPGIIDRPPPAPGEAQYQRAVAFGGQQMADQYKADQTAAMLRKGATGQDLDAWWGTAPGSSESFHQTVQANMQRNLPNGAHFAQNPAEAWSAGWDMSVSGLATNRALPKTVLPADAPLISKLFAGTAQFLGDLPTSLPGAIAGAAGGTGLGAAVPGAGETGASEAAGGLIGGGFGFNAVPEAARQIMVDTYRRGDYKSWSDVQSAAFKSTWEVMKQGTVGAVSNLVGGKAGAAVLKFGGEEAAASMAGKFTAGGVNAGAQAATSATLSAGLEGHVPDAQDFLTGGLMALGLHAAGHFVGGRYQPTAGEQRVQKNLEDIYARTGTPPWEVAKRAISDPLYRQEVTAQDVNGDPVHPNIRADAQDEPPPFKATPPQENSQAIDAAEASLNAPAPAAEPERTFVNNQEVKPAAGHVVDKDIAATMDRQAAAGQTQGMRNVTPVKGSVVNDPSSMTPLIQNLETGGLRGKQIDAAVSPTGAIGRYQIEPGTARQYGFDPAKLHDPAYNTMVHTAIVTDLARRYRGNVNAVLIGYNAGPGRAGRYMAQGPGTGLKEILDKSVAGGRRYETIPVDRNESFLPMETQKYLAKARRIEGGPLPAGTPLDIEGHNGGPSAPSAGPEGANPELDAELHKGSGEEEPLDLTRPAEQPGLGGGDGGAANAWKGASVEDLSKEMLGQIGEQPKTDYMSLEKARTQFISELEPARAIDRRLIAAGQLDRTKDMGVEDVFRQTYGSASRAGAFVRYGEVNPITKEIVPGSPTFMDAVKQMRDAKGSPDEWKAYMLAKRTVQKAGIVADPQALARAQAETGTAKLNQSMEMAKLDPVKQPAAYAKAQAKWKTRLQTLADKETEAKAGIDTGFNQQAAAELASNPEAIAKYEGATQTFNRVNDGFLRYMQGSGMISPESLQRMTDANSTYISMRRIMGDDASFGGSAGRGFGITNTLRKMEGSDRQIVDPFLATLDNQRVGIQMADRNMARGFVINLAAADPKTAALIGLKKIGAVDPNYDEVDSTLKAYGFKDADLDAAREAYGSLIAARQEKGLPGNQFLYYNQGKAERWQVDSPELARLMRNADSTGETNIVMKAAQTFAAIQRTGIVIQPDFPGRMTIWHQFNQFVMDPLHPPPVFTWLRGIAHVIGQDDVYQKVVANGGLGAAMVDLDRDFLAKDMDSVLDKTGALDKVWNSVRHPLQFAQLISEKLDAANRVGYFVGATKDGSRSDFKAATMARKAGLDYAERATAQIANNMAKVVPFWRPHLLGLKQGWESFADNGTGHPNMDRAATVAAGVAAISVPLVAMYLLNRQTDASLPDGEKYTDLPRWQRDRMLITPPIGGVRFKLRMPANYGFVFGTLVQRSLDAFVAHDPKAFDGWAQDFMSEYMPPMLPAFAAPATEVVTNHNFYTGKPLVSDSLRERSPELQYTENTTEPAKQLSRLIGAGFGQLGMQDATISPMAIEHLVSGYTGSAGMEALRIVNAPLTQNHQPGDLADIPFVQGFVVRHPGMSSQRIGDFYDTFHQFQEQAGDFKYLKGQAQALGQDSIDTSQVDLAQAQAVAPLTNLSKALAVQRSLIEGINHNTTMTVDEKRQHIETLYGQAIQEAVYGSALMDVIKDRAKNPDQKMSEMDQLSSEFNTRMEKYEGQQ